MKNATKFLTAITAMAIAVTFSSCQKGDTGATGPAGQNGINGNANVVSSTVNVTSSSQWTFNSGLYYVTINYPAITQAIVNTGIVEVFISIDGGTTWNAIPTTYVGSTENAFWSFDYVLGSANIFFKWNSGNADGAPNTIYGTSIYIKVACIASSVIKQHPNTNWNDYKQIQNLIN